MERKRRRRNRVNEGEDGGRYSSKRKTEAVLRLLRGEELDPISRELGVTAARLSEWRERFLASGTAGLKSRPVTAEEDEVGRLKAKIGDLTMRIELHEMREAKLGLERPLVQRRSRR